MMSKLLNELHRALKPIDFMKWIRSYSVISVNCDTRSRIREKKTTGFTEWTSHLISYKYNYKYNII